MPTSEDYRQVANRTAQIAIACAAPSVAETLMALVLTTWPAAKLSRSATATQQRQQDPSDAFGD